MTASRSEIKGCAPIRAGHSISEPANTIIALLFITQGIHRLKRRGASGGQVPEDQPH